MSSDGESQGADLMSFADQLRVRLDQLARRSDELLAASTIEYRGDFNRGGGVVFIAPDWAWSEPNEAVRRLQMAVVPELDEWARRIGMLFEDAPQDLVAQLTEVQQQIREWLSRDGTAWSGWDVPRTLDVARQMMADRFSKVRALLEFVAPEGQPMSVIAVPDTSALMDHPSLQEFGGLFGEASVELVLVPNVLAELDTLKDQGRTPEARQRARAAGAQMKAVRAGGSLVAGVQLTSQVAVRSRPVEPNFAKLPGTLDPGVPDDRILAAAFELQRSKPASVVVLITPDINLQTKAEMVGIPFVEPPAPHE
jgi:rRNA-processing protein FCF1